MTDLYLQDSSFWILTHRRNTPQRAAERSTELLRGERVAINEMVRFEILRGYWDDAETRLVSYDLDSLDFLNLTREVWDWTRTLDGRLKRAGLPKAFPDLLIAATAIHYDAMLLHADSDFEVIAQHSALRTESYVDLAQA